MSKTLKVAEVAESARIGDVFTYYDGSSVTVVGKEIDGGKELRFKPDRFPEDHAGMGKELFIRSYGFREFTKVESEAKAESEAKPEGTTAKKAAAAEKSA